MRLAYAKESIPDGPEGIILESVMEGYAEYYSENLSQNVKRGFYDSALELKTLGQRVLGLRKSPDDHFEIDPPQPLWCAGFLKNMPPAPRPKPYSPN